MKSKWRVIKGLESRKLNAFTLLETLLVVLVCASFVFIPTIATVSLQEEMRVKQFFRSFEKGILVLSETCVAKSESGTIFFDHQKIEYATAHENLSRITLEIPKEIEILEFPKNASIQFDAYGKNSTLPRIRFKNKGTKKIITFQFQVGSGKYRVSEEDG